MEPNQRFRTIFHGGLKVRFGFSKTKPFKDGAIFARSRKKVNSKTETDKDKTGKAMQFEKMKLVLGLRYRNLQLLGIPWMPHIHLVGEDYMMPVLRVTFSAEHEDTDEKYIHLKDLFQTSSKMKTQTNFRYWIKGAPCYGKTSLLKKLAVDWARRKEYIAERFQLAVYVSLRNLKNSSFIELLENETVANGISEPLALLVDEQRTVLLLLDHYDELPSTKQSELHEVLNGKLFPEISLVMTSRNTPEKEFNSLKNWAWNKIISAEGTSQEEGMKFLCKRLHGCQQNVIEVKRKLRPIFKDNADCMILQCPLLLLFIENWVNEGYPIASKAEIYKGILNLIVRRNLLREQLIDRNQQLDLFNKCSAYGIKNTFYYQLLVSFGKFAFDKLYQLDRSYFHKEELASFPDIKHIFLMGCIKQSNELCHETEGNEIYESSVPELFEFLIARYLVSELDTLRSLKSANNVGAIKRIPVSISKVLPLISGNSQNQSVRTIRVFLEEMIDKKVLQFLQALIMTRSSCERVSSTNEVKALSCLEYLPEYAVVGNTNKGDLLHERLASNQVKTLKWYPLRSLPLEKITIPNIILSTNYGVKPVADYQNVQCQQLVVQLTRLNREQKECLRSVLNSVSAETTILEVQSCDDWMPNDLKFLENIDVHQMNIKVSLSSTLAFHTLASLCENITVLHIEVSSSSFNSSTKLKLRKLLENSTLSEFWLKTLEAKQLYEWYEMCQSNIQKNWKKMQHFEFLLASHFLLADDLSIERANGADCSTAICFPDQVPQQIKSQPWNKFKTIAELVYTDQLDLNLFQNLQVLWLSMLNISLLDSVLRLQELVGLELKLLIVDFGLSAPAPFVALSHVPKQDDKKTQRYSDDNVALAEEVKLISINSQSVHRLTLIEQMKYWLRCKTVGSLSLVDGDLNQRILRDNFPFEEYIVLFQLYKPASILEKCMHSDKYHEYLIIPK